MQRKRRTWRKSSMRQMNGLWPWRFGMKRDDSIGSTISGKRRRSRRCRMKRNGNGRRRKTGERGGRKRCL